MTDGIPTHVTTESLLAAGLTEIRRWHRRFWLGLAAWPAVVILAAIAHAVSDSTTITTVPVVLWMFIVAACMVKANVLMCPRCGRSFYPIGPLQLPWKPTCPSCELALFAPPP